MADDLATALRTHFGFGGFRRGQEEAIRALLAEGGRTPAQLGLWG